MRFSVMAGRKRVFALDVLAIHVFLAAMRLRKTDGSGHA